MSETSARHIIVDDVDPSIQYTGPWYPDQGSRDSVGNFGPPYQSTLHGVNHDASLSYAFNGSQVTVIGSNDILNKSGFLNPTWDCFVDDISIGTTDPFPYPENNWVFCTQPSLVDGPHVLTVNATVLKNQTFWFDNIQYLPSASVPLNQAAIIVDSLDSQLQYGTGWGPRGEDGEDANMTTVAGSIFTFDFIGVSLSWYGYIPAELPSIPSSATYSIDGETPISFLLSGALAANSTTPVFLKKFFETAQLSPTSHTLKVVYEGNNSTPLTLDYLIIQNGTSSSTTTSISSLPTSTGNTVSATSTPKGFIPVNPIVGGVIGGIALVVFATLGFFLLRQRQKRDAQEKVFTSTPRPFEYPQHLSSTTPNPSSVGFSSSQVPQIAPELGSHVTHGVKKQVNHVSVPSVTNTDSIEPPNTSSGSSVPVRRTALNLANPSSSSPPSLAQPVPLPSIVKREPEVLATLRPLNSSVPTSVQSNVTWLSDANVVLHADSGIRMLSNTTSTSVVDVPPEYTPN